MLQIGNQVWIKNTALNGVLNGWWKDWQRKKEDYCSCSESWIEGTDCINYKQIV